MGGSSDSDQEHHQQPPNSDRPLADTNDDCETRPPTGPSYMNGIYYPSWLVYKNKTPATLDVENITHVFYAFVGLV